MAGHLPRKDDKERLPRATRAQQDLRIARLGRLMAKGATKRDCYDYAASEWGMSLRRAQEIVKMAIDRNTSDWTLNRSDFAALLLDQLAELKKVTAQKDNHSVQLGCINTMAKIARLLE